MSFLLQENFLYQSILFSWSEMVRSQKHPGHGFEEALDLVERPLLSIHFKEESISLCHPESASFDSQNVFFEMDWPLRSLRHLRGVSSGGRLHGLPSGCSRSACGRCFAPAFSPY